MVKSPYNDTLMVGLAQHVVRNFALLLPYLTPKPLGPIQSLRPLVMVRDNGYLWFITLSIGHIWYPAVLVSSSSHIITSHINSRTLVTLVLTAGALLL
jgi:hypothetical protein